MITFMKMSSLVGQFLIAMPTMQDPRFVQSVLYICAHNQTGAMGLIVNRLYAGLDSLGLFEQLNIEPSHHSVKMPLHFGGPIETGRGFILHTDDVMKESSLPIADDVAMTGTTDILVGIASGDGPRRTLIALGYAGWAAGQLEKELQESVWLTVPSDTELLFHPDLETKWDRAIGKLGISPWMLSSQHGRA